MTPESDGHKAEMVPSTVGPHRVQVSAAGEVGAPAAYAGQAEGMLALQQTELPVCSIRLLQHTLEADAAVDLPAALRRRHALRPGLAVHHMVLAVCRIVGVEAVAAAVLQHTEAT